jgi:hypothetical protein
VLRVPHLSSPWSDLHPSWSPLCTLVGGTNNGECLKMAVGHQEFLTIFARAVNHAAEDELEEDLLQQVTATTLEEELSSPCLDDVANYFCLVEEEAEFLDLEQEVKPETSPVELKQLPSGLQYVFLRQNFRTWSKRSSLKPLLLSSNSCHRDCSMCS